MSTVMWHDERLYADSRFVRGEETFEALDKVQLFKNPVPLKSVKQEIDDLVHAYVYVGATFAAKGFAENLSKFDNVDNLLTLYRQLQTLRVHNRENHFELWAIGEKANYQFEFIDGCALNARPHGVSWGTGTGGRAAMKSMLDRNTHPTKAMLSAFYKVETAGGFIEMWRFHDINGKKRFLRSMVWEPVVEEKIPRELMNMSLALPGGFVRMVEAYDYMVRFVLGIDPESENDLNAYRKFLLSPECRRAKARYLKRLNQPKSPVVKKPKEA